MVKPRLLQRPRFLWACEWPDQGFAINNAKLSEATSTNHSFGYPGVTPSISANGTVNGILWAVENSTPAVLHAFDPENLSIEYYSGNQLGPGNKYITPMIANGQVFVGTGNSVAVYGLTPKPSLPNGTYSIIGQMSTLALQEGSSIVQEASSGASDQKWIFSAVSGGDYTIRNAASGLYLADPAGRRQMEPSWHRKRRMAQRHSNGPSPSRAPATQSTTGQAGW